MNRIRLSFRQTMMFVLMVMALLWQGTSVAVASDINEAYVWDLAYIPAESPKTIEEVRDILKKNPDVFNTVFLEKGKGKTQGIDTLSFYMLQHLDYNEKDKNKVKQIYQLVTIIHYAGADHTTVMHTNGYDTKNMGMFHCDLAKALDANMIEVEHRYTGYSLPTPESYEKNGGFLRNDNFWNYNRAEQQSTDIAYVVNTLKKLKIFTGKWVSSGTSKSGMTTTFLAMHHPETCDVYVPFCAPFCQVLDEPLSYWAGEGYGKHLKEVSPKEYEAWQASWQRVKDFAKNPTLRQEMINRARAQYVEKDPNYTYDDAYCLTGLYIDYVREWFSKAAYHHVNEWIDLMPSYVSPTASVSQEYCDSMYRYITIKADSLARYVQKKKEATGGSKRRSGLIRRYDDMTRTYGLMNKHYQRRASGTDAATGLDSAILTLDAYYVQTIYELGNYIEDYTPFKEELEALNGKDYLAKQYIDDLIFNKNEYKPIVKYIGLNTTQSPYKPLYPIAPKVRDFVKTTKAKIVFVYGGLDPWTQAGIKDEDIPSTQTNITRFLVPNGIHADDVLSPTYSTDATIGTKIINKVKELLNNSTGISTIPTSTPVSRNSDVIYNLNGQQVDKSYKGIVIINGKKIRQ